MITVATHQQQTIFGKGLDRRLAVELAALVDGRVFDVGEVRTIFVIVCMVRMTSRTKDIADGLSGKLDAG